jgi:hypothetical protein
MNTIYSIKDLQTIGNTPQLKQTGIFIMRCLPTGDSFIGWTTRGFRTRWKEFRKQARNLNNRRISPQIRELWQQYGDEGFEFQILEVTNRKVEQTGLTYIKRYRPTLNQLTRSC